MRAVKKRRYVLYSGAVRAGKTLLAAHIAIQTCIENPRCIGMLGSLTTPQLQDASAYILRSYADGDMVCGYNGIALVIYPRYLD